MAAGPYPAGVDTATLTFLVVGGAGVALLALGLLGSELLAAVHAGADAVVPLEAVAGFVGAFGFAGAAAAALTGPATPGRWAVCAGAGVVAAVPAAVFAVRLSRAARDMPTDATPTRADLVGALGVVVTPVPAGGYGEVRVRLAGQPVKVYARADAPLPAGAAVFVVEAPTDTSVVVERTVPLT